MYQKGTTAFRNHAEIISSIGWMHYFLNVFSRADVQGHVTHANGMASGSDLWKIYRYPGDTMLCLHCARKIENLTIRPRREGQAKAMPGQD
jgi:hypothetical protein